MSNDRARTFADALQTLESSGDVEAFVSGQFTETSELHRPETDQQTRGLDGARLFWEQYLNQFESIASTFSRVEDRAGLGVLEWSSTGQVAGGAPVEYRGVSLIDFDDDGRVARFATYYDTARFAAVTPPTDR
ncbi:nuclear transport factor 2 family protein [Nakamurella endophytica]|uniref:Epoxide hydrolase n=1 Tax=Nakamurella endophytica TaxID=1748367 RepID=A0A917SPP7_9ACTN|nr:nuclear transport factor 2 family protein [Nakamurella endophytica]GGL91344.1 epoxide hydrolase [Nakamurella endophytica]